MLVLAAAIVAVRDRGERSPVRRLAALFLFTAALSKTTAISLPLVIGIVTLMRADQAGGWRSLAAAAPYAAVEAVLIAITVRVRSILPWTAVALLAWATVLRLDPWRADLPFWSAQLESGPESWQAREGLAWALQREGRTAEAAGVMREAALRFGSRDAAFAGADLRLAKLWSAVGWFESRLGHHQRAADAFARGSAALAAGS